MILPILFFPLNEGRWRYSDEREILIFYLLFMIDECCLAIDQLYMDAVKLRVGVGFLGTKTQRHHQGILQLYFVSLCLRGNFLLKKRIQTMFAVTKKHET